MPGLESLPPWGFVWIAAVMLLSGYTHGVIGFGFPLIATPLLALLLDLKTTLLLTLLPTLAVCLTNAFRGGNLRASIGAYWFLPLVLMAGSYFGTRVMIVVDSRPLVLVLAGILLVYLNVDRLGHTDLPVVRRHPVAAGALFGFAAGVFEATVNVSGPMLLIYFLLLGISPVVLVQALNFCFVSGKAAQAFGWAESGGIGAAQWLSTVPWALLGLATLFAGERIRRGVSAVTYLGWLRKFLWAMAILLVFQFVRVTGWA